MKCHKINNDIKYVLPVGSMRVKQLKAGSWWKRLITWLKDYDDTGLRHRVPKKARGDLAETMRGLEK